MKLFVLGTRFLLGGILLYGGLGEIRRPFEFLASVHAYRLTGPMSGVVVTGLVPWLEVVTGVCLLVGILTQGAFLGGLLLMGLFSVAVGSAWLRGLPISCGCFGSSGDDVIGGATVVRSLTLVALSAVGLWLNCRCRMVSAAPAASSKTASAFQICFCPAGNSPPLARASNS